MSTFEVAPQMVVSVGGRLGAVSGGIDDLHGQLGTHRGAAGGTPADGALQSLFGHWSAVLPLFSQAGDHLAGAVHGAAAAYAVTDGVIGGACMEGQCPGAQG